MKWNWGTKIMLSFVGFVGFMGYLVVSSFQENIDLVTEDYYGAELKYEQRINEIKRANELGTTVQVQEEIDSYTIKLPQKVINKGEVHFYRPNDQRFDKVYSFQNNQNSLIVKKTDLLPGKFRIKIAWEAEGEKYYFEDILFVK